MIEDIESIYSSEEEEIKKKLIEEINDNRITVNVSIKTKKGKEMVFLEFYEVKGEWTRAICDIGIRKREIPYAHIAYFVKSLVRGGEEQTPFDFFSGR